MKTRIATVLSIAGVLVAGSAAALANTQILSAEQTSGASAAVLPPTESVDLTVPPIETSTTTTSTSTTTPTTTTAGSSEASGQPSAAPAAQAESYTSDYLTTFNIGAAGAVTVDVIAGKVRLVDAVPGDGWRLVDTEEEHGELHVEFRSSSVAVVLDASFDGDKIVPKVTSYSLAAAPASSNRTAAPAPTADPATSGQTAAGTTGDDFEDEDEYEHEDEYESEDHDDEYEQESEDHEDHEDERDDD